MNLAHSSSWPALPNLVLGCQFDPDGSRRLLQGIKGPAIRNPPISNHTAATSDSWLARRQSLMPCPAVVLAWCLAAAVT
jgi:hypothetical protein